MNKNRPVLQELLAFYKLPQKFAVCETALINQSNEKIGGKEKIVEIDESLF
ncbi:10663_t:CDS:2, partial [Scutellospora calospora]